MSTEEDVAKPLSTLPELLSWKQDCISPAWKEILDSVPSIARAPNTTPKTLVCHDMKGGYTDDKYFYGTRNNTAYRYHYWSSIDVFVYFSHYFVTIPPPGWTMAAHTNNVPILGTLITEGDAGEEICKEMFSSVAMVETIVGQLINIAKHHKMQGWLINIENKLDPVAIGLVLHFLSQLTKMMKKLDKQSFVIWYDSVTHDGELKWQDELNHKNSYFYENCDAIFLNYSWTPAKLQASRNFAIALSEGDEAAASKVYVGVDVFGRNFYEGGGFNSYKAMEVIRHEGLSAAIFAPAWTHETLPVEDFVENDTRLWQSMRNYLTQHGPRSWPVSSCFNDAVGTGLWSQGEIEYEGPWFNLTKQSLLPNLTQDGDVKLSLSTEDAYNGGGALCVSNQFDRSKIVSLWSNCWLSDAHEVKVEVAFKSGSFISFNMRFDELRNDTCELLLEFSSGGCNTADNPWDFRSVVRRCPDLPITAIKCSFPSLTVLKLGWFSLKKANI